MRRNRRACPPTSRRPAAACCAAGGRATGAAGPACRARWASPRPRPRGRRCPRPTSAWRATWRPRRGSCAPCRCRRPAARPTSRRCCSASAGRGRRPSWRSACARIVGLVQQRQRLQVGHAAHGLRIEAAFAEQRPPVRHALADGRPGSRAAARPARPRWPAAPATGCVRAAGARPPSRAPSAARAGGRPGRWRSVCSSSVRHGCRCDLSGPA